MIEAQQHQLAGEATRLIRDRQDDKAIAVLDKLIAVLPHREDLHTSRAYCLGRLGRFDEAYRICKRLNEVSDTPRVQHLRMFLDKRMRERPQQERPPAVRALDLSLATDASQLPRSLAEKLERVRHDIEREFEQYRTRDSEATATIQKLRMRAHEHEQALHSSERHSEELEELLAELGTELAAFSDGPALSPLASRLANGDVTLSRLEETEAEIEGFKRNLAERDETLEATFRRNGELERVIARLKAESAELNERNELFEATEEDLRKELQNARAGIGNALSPEIVPVVETLQKALDEARVREVGLEQAREAITEQIHALREEMESARADDLAAAPENESQRAELADKERLLEMANEAVSQLNEQLQAAQAEIDRLLERESEITSQISSIVGEIGGNRTDFEALLAEKSELEDRLARLEAEHRVRQHQDEVERSSVDIEQAVRDETARESLDEKFHLERELHETKGRFDELSAKERDEQVLLENLTQEIEAKQLELDQAVSANDTLQQRLTTLREEYEIVASRGLELAAEGQAASVDLEKTQARVAELESKNERLEKLFGETESRLEDVRERESQMTRAMETLEAEVVEQRDTLDALALEKVGLTRELKYTESLLEGSETRERKAREHSELLEGNLADDAERTQEVERDRAELRGRIGGLEERVGELSSKGDVAAVLIKDLSADLDARNQELEGLRREKARLSEQIEALGEQRAALAEAEKVRSTQVTRLSAELEERNAAFVAESEEKSETELALSRLRTEHGYLVKQENEAQLRIESLTQEIAMRDARIEALESEGGRLAGSLESAERNVGELEGVERESAERIAVLDRELGSEQAKAEELGQQRKTLDEDVTRLRNELEGVLEREVAALDEIDILRHDLADRESDIGSLKQARDEGKTEIEALTQGIVEREERLRGLETARTELSGRIAELENELFPLRDREAEAQADLETVGFELDQLFQESEDTKQELEVALGRVEDMKTMVGEYDRTLTEERAAKLELDRTAATLAEELSDVSERRDAAAQEAAHLGEELALTRSELDGALSEKTEVESAMESLQGDLAALQEEHAALNSRSQELDEQLSSVQNSLEAATTGNAELEETKRILERDLEELREKREAAVSRAEQLSERLATLEIQLDKANEAVALSKGEISELHLDLSLRDQLLDETRQHVGVVESELGRVKPELQHLYATELPEALEQKVRVLRQMQKMKVEIELLRSQLW